VKQGGAPPTGKWVGSPLGGVKAPDALILPDPTTRFLGSAVRLEELSDGHPMKEWLCFTADLARAQHAVATTLGPFADLEQSVVDQALATRTPPLAVDTHHRDPTWRDSLVKLLAHFDGRTLPLPPAAAIANLRDRGPASVEALADSFLNGDMPRSDAGAAVYIAAALQVYFTRLAAGLDAPSLRLLQKRGLCPCCGSTPVSGVVTATGQTPGTRYLYCSLCSTAWSHVRAVCITCGGSRTLSLRGIEGDSGAIKAETCDECHTYAKMLYQTKDMQVDPFADDLATLGLDILVAEAGWARHAPNALLLVA
jgi:FdhE protein